MELGEGTYAVKRWSLEEFGYYEDYTEIPMTPSQIVNSFVEGPELEGFSRMMSNVRKQAGGASVSHWTAGKKVNPEVKGVF